MLKLGSRGSERLICLTQLVSSLQRQSLNLEHQVNKTGNSRLTLPNPPLSCSQQAGRDSQLKQLSGQQAGGDSGQAPL